MIVIEYHYNENRPLDNRHYFGCLIFTEQKQIGPKRISFGIIYLIIENWKYWN